MKNTTAKIIDYNKGFTDIINSFDVNINQLEIQKSLGNGANATVKLAFSKKLSEIFAVKIY